MPDSTGKTLYGVSKTSIQGVLSVIVIVLTSLLTYQVPTALLTPQVSHVWLWVTASANLVVVILKAVVSFMQGDAPTS